MFIFPCSEMIWKSTSTWGIELWDNMFRGLWLISRIFPKGTSTRGIEIWDDSFGIFLGPCKASPRNPGILCFDSGRAWGLGSRSCGESVCAKWVGISRYEGQMIYPFHVVNNYLNCDLHRKSDAVHLREGSAPTLFL